MFLWIESALGKGSCAATPVPHCQLKDSSAVCCLESHSMATDRGLNPVAHAAALSKGKRPCQFCNRKRKQPPLPHFPALCVGVRGLANLEMVQPVHPLLLVGAQTHPCAWFLTIIYYKQPDMCHTQVAFLTM